MLFDAMSEPKASTDIYIHTQHDIAWAGIMWAFDHSVVNVDASLEAILTTGWNELRKVYVLFQKSRMILAVQ